MRAGWTALTVVTLALGACGESSEEKAQNTVCDARDDSSSLSASDAKAGVVTTLQQLEASYQKTFAPLNCD